MNGIRKLRQRQRNSHIAILERVQAQDETELVLCRKTVATVSALIENRKIKTAKGILEACQELARVADQRLRRSRQDLKRWKASRF